MGMISSEINITITITTPKIGNNITTTSTIGNSNDNFLLLMCNAFMHKRNVFISND